MLCINNKFKFKFKYLKIRQLLLFSFEWRDRKKAGGRHQLFIHWHGLLSFGDILEKMCSGEKAARTWWDLEIKGLVMVDMSGREELKIGKYNPNLPPQTDMSFSHNTGMPSKGQTVTPLKGGC